MAETDAEFMERIGLDFDLSNTADIQRLFALARRGAESQWRPIEDAPDGKEILLGGLKFIGVGWRVEDRWFLSDGERIENVQGWMPLPPPPEDKA